MIKWSLILLPERGGKVIVGTLGYGMCSVLVKKRMTERQRDWFVRWKACAEWTLYSIALDFPNYSPDVGRITNLLMTMAGDGDGYARYCGNVIDHGSQKVYELFTLQRGSSKKLCYVSFVKNQTFIAMDKHKRDTDFWKLLKPTKAE